MSVAEFGAEDFLRPLRQVRLCFEQREERQVPALPTVLRDPIADQLKGRPELILRKLIQVLQLDGLFETLIGGQVTTGGTTGACPRTGKGAQGPWQHLL
jgi:hypothetical protein